MTDATIGWGGKCSIQNSDGDWVELDEVTEFPFPMDEVADLDATHMLSPGKRKEYIAGLIDGGTGDVVTNYVPGSDTDVLCRELVSSGDDRGFRVDLLQSDDSYYRIATTIIAKQYKRSAPIDNRMTATLTVRFTGDASESDI